MMVNGLRSVLLLGLVGMILAWPAPKIDRKKCQKREGVFEKPGSFCRSYYKCSNWIPREVTCPPGQHFIPHWRRCDYAELYRCLEKPRHKECRSPNGIFLKPGTQCKTYFSCCDGHPTEKNCPDDTLFDPEAEKCEWAELYTCVEGISSTSTPTVTPIATLSTPDDIKTSDDIVHLTSESSVDPETVKTGISSTSTPTVTSATTLSTPYDIQTSDDTVHSTSESSVDPETVKTGISSTSTPTVTPGATLSTPGDIQTLDDVDSKSTSRFVSSTILSTPNDTPTAEEISSMSTSLFRSSTTKSSLEDISTFDGTHTTMDITITNQKFLISSTISLSSTKGTTTSISKDTSPVTEPNIKSTSSQVTVFDFSTTHADETSSENKVTASTDSNTVTEGVTSQSTSPTTSTEDVSTLTPSQMTKQVSSSTFTDSTLIEEEIITLLPSSPGIPNIVCPERSGYFPHPTDKHKFIGCVDWKPNVMSCPSNLVYNHSRRACVYDKT